LSEVVDRKSQFCSDATEAMTVQRRRETRLGTIEQIGAAAIPGQDSKRSNVNSSPIIVIYAVIAIQVPMPATDQTHDGSGAVPGA
jgi:hypothetical protein